MAKRWLARLRRLVRSPMCPHCRVRHPVDSLREDFLLCVVRAERRRIERALLARRARSTTFDAFSHRLCTSLIAALDLTIDQADGSRPMTVDELRHYTGHRP